MARYTDTVTSPHSAAEIFDYLADLRSVAEWDPSVDRIRLVSGEPGTAGARYQLEMSFLGKEVSLPYATVTVEPPSRVVFAAETGVVAIRDEAQIRSTHGAGSSVTWEARLRPKGVLRLLDPLLGLVFHRMGSRAARGLARRVGEPTAPELGKGAPA
jgi:hypothetical protein